MSKFRQDGKGSGAGTVAGAGAGGGKGEVKKSAGGAGSGGDVGPGPVQRVVVPEKKKTTHVPPPLPTEAAHTERSGYI